ncbi:MAG: VWA domain-containing protein [Candidatus Limnocylindrales bacterium]|jgi:Ca-activated chloride channel family protein
MDFLWSGLLVLLLLLPVLVAVYTWSLRRARRSGVRYSSLALVRDAEPGSSRMRRHLPFVLLLAALGSLVVAMARPVVILAVPTNQTTIILTIDVSGSMCSSDVPPSRLEAAEAAAAAFISSQSSSTRIGIVAFSSFAEVVQSPTNDQTALLNALHSLATGQRTAIGDGILASIDAISTVDPAVARSQTGSTPGTAPAPVPKGDYAPDIVVLLTDGASNTGTPPLDAAQQAADRGVRVYTIGFGTANGGARSPTCAPQFVGHEPGGGAFAGGRGGGGFASGIDVATLEQIAAVTGGTYYPAATASQLDSVFRNLPTNLIVEHQAAEISVVFVGLGALFAALAILLGRAWRPLP